MSERTDKHASVRADAAFFPKERGAQGRSGKFTRSRFSPKFKCVSLLCQPRVRRSYHRSVSCQLQAKETI